MSRIEQASQDGHRRPDNDSNSRTVDSPGSAGLAGQPSPSKSFFGRLAETLTSPIRSVSLLANANAVSAEEEGISFEATPSTVQQRIAPAQFPDESSPLFADNNRVAHAGAVDSPLRQQLPSSATRALAADRHHGGVGVGVGLSVGLDDDRERVVGGEVFIDAEAFHVGADRGNSGADRGSPNLASPVRTTSSRTSVHANPDDTFSDTVSSGVSGTTLLHIYNDTPRSERLSLYLGLPPLERSKLDAALAAERSSGVTSGTFELEEEEEEVVGELDAGGEEDDDVQVEINLEDYATNFTNGSLSGEVVHMLNTVDIDESFTLGGGAVSFNAVPTQGESMPTHVAGVIFSRKTRLPPDHEQYLKQQTAMTAAPADKDRLGTNSWATTTPEAGDFGANVGLAKTLKAKHDKLDGLERRLKQLDLAHMASVPQVRDSRFLALGAAAFAQYHPSQVFQPNSDRKLFKQYAFVTREEVGFYCEFTVTNMHYKDGDKSSNHILFQLVQNYCTPALLKLVEPEFELAFRPEQRGGISFLYSVLKHLYFGVGQSEEMLVSLITSFADGSLILKTPGMNLLVVKENTMPVWEQLLILGGLRPTMVKNLITGYTHSPNETVRDEFKQRLRDFNLAALNEGTGPISAQLGTYSSEQQLAFYNQGVDVMNYGAKLFSHLSALGEYTHKKGRALVTYTTPGGGTATGIICFSCTEQGHPYYDCPKPLDWPTIEKMSLEITGTKHTKEYYEAVLAKRKKSQSNGGGDRIPSRNADQSTSGGGGGGNGGGKGKTISNTPRFQFVDGEVKFRCSHCKPGKGQALTDHPTKYHAQAMKEGATPYCDIYAKENPHCALSKIIKGLKKGGGINNSAKSTAFVSRIQNFKSTDDKLFAQLAQHGHASPQGQAAFKALLANRAQLDSAISDFACIVDGRSQADFEAGGGGCQWWYFLAFVPFIYMVCPLHTWLPQLLWTYLISPLVLHFVSLRTSVTRLDSGQIGWLLRDAAYYAISARIMGWWTFFTYYYQSWLDLLLPISVHFIECCSLAGTFILESFMRPWDRLQDRLWVLYGFTDLCWMWMDCMPLFGWWIGWLGWAISGVDYFISVLAVLDLDAPQFRRRRRKKPPNLNRYYTGKRRRYQLRWLQAARAAERAIIQKLQAQQQHAAEMADFLGVDGFMSEEQGRFQLYEHDPVALENFVRDEMRDPTAIVRLQNSLITTSHSTNARAAWLRSEAAKAHPAANLLMHNFDSPSLNNSSCPDPSVLDPGSASSSKKKKKRRGKKTVEPDPPSFEFLHTPAVLDTGASYGLTPFREDFVTYEEVDVTVKGVGSENRVSGFGMVLYRAKASNGDTIYMPGLAYHMASTDIHLISPQSYHQVWGGHSVVEGSQYHLHLDKPVNGIPTVSHVIDVDIDSATNLPLLRDVATTPKEKADIGPLFARRMGLAQKSKQGFFFGADGGWYLTRIEDEDFATPMEVDYSFGLYDHIVHAHNFECVTSESNANLGAPQKELLLWHHRLGCSMKKVQHLMKPHTRAKSEGGPSVRYPPVIPTKHASTSTCDAPLCATCQIARAKVRKPESKKEKAVKKNEGVLYKNKYAPGDFVSMDTVSVPIKGRLFSGFGADSADSYAGVTIFHDAGSGIIRVYPQLAMTAGDSLASKIEFENFLWETAGVAVKHYHSDGGVFTAEAFQNDCKLKKQEQTFSGVGAKHQNAGAERSVQTVSWMCRTFLLHAALRWAGHGSDDPTLWPQALCYAEWLFNRTPSMSSGMSPMERLTGALSDHRELLRARVWGSPTYVLEAKLQDGGKVPKFAARAKIGQFMGFSPSHSSMVGIVRNLTTNHMSAQYHIVVDEKFETVWGIDPTSETLDDKVNGIWTRLFTSGVSRDLYVSPEYDPDTGELLYEPPPMEPEWLTPEELRDRDSRLQDQVRRGAQHRKRLENEFKTEEPLQQPDRKVVIDEHPTVFNPPVESEGDGLEATVESDSVDRIVDTSVPDDVPTSNPWAGRIRKKRSSWKDLNRGDDRVNLSTSTWHHAKTFTPAQLASLSDNEKKILREVNDTFSHFNITLSRDRQVPIEVKRKAQKPRLQRQSLERFAELSEQHLRAMKLEIDNIEDFMNSPLSQHIQLATNYSGYGGGVKELICDYVSPWFLNAKTGISAADNPSWEQAMNGDEAEGYWEAAKLEIATLEKMKAWDVVDRSTVPKGQRVLPGLWALKKKRLPSGEVRKLKARFTVRGDKQIAGVDFNETWAPVCKWTTVRMMFILQLMLGLKSSAADVECAFLHGTLPPEEQVYVEMPKGFVQPGKVLKLRQSLYGLKQAPRCFWEYLTKVMEENGMHQSKFDSCLFVGEKVIALAYVDDILFWSKDESDITDLMVKLRESGLMLERESDAAGFLGVDINVLEEDADGRPTKMELTQQGLIDRIITNLGLDGTPGDKAVPAQLKPLHRDDDGPACEGDFNYAAVVGQLLYLSGHTRPDIAYSVNCCARYMFSPKRSHELALKQIGRYLRGTRKRGIIITPSENLLSIDAFPDADFCGMYGVERPDDPACVKSRTGFVICISKVPVLWMSKLQSKTALSTMEAEISALAHCCRELFPIMDISQYFTEYFKLGPSVTTMNVSVHEDNASALILAQSIPPEYTPRSKFFHLETVWFREEIVKRGIKLLKIDTKEQLGDIFTKGLPKVVFEYLRFKLCGW